MPQKTCWKCGSSYDGLSCPVCVVGAALEKQTDDLTLAMEEASRQNEEAAREVQAAVEASAVQMEMAISGAAEQHRRSIADAWRLQAQAKTEKAFELYKAKMYDEAIRMLLDALNQDASNLEIYIIASWTYEAKGDQNEALAFYKKQITLLEAKPYRRDPRWASRILSGLPNRPELITAFSVTVERILTDLQFSEAPLEFIVRLQTFGLRQTALLVASVALNQTPSLGLFALHIEIVGASSQSEVMAFEEYLKAQPFDRQPYLLQEFEGFSSKKCGVSNATLTLMKNKLRKWFQSWEPERAKRSRERATAQGKASGNDDSGPTVFGWISGVGAWIIELAIGAAIETFSGNEIPISLSMMLVFLGIAACAGIFIYHLMRENVIASATRRAEVAEAAAEAEWQRRVASTLNY